MGIALSFRLKRVLSTDMPPGFKHVWKYYFVGWYRQTTFILRVS